MQCNATLASKQTCSHSTEPNWAGPGRVVQWRNEWINKHMKQASEEPKQSKLVAKMNERWKMNGRKWVKFTLVLLLFIGDKAIEFCYLWLAFRLYIFISWIPPTLAKKCKQKNFFLSLSQFSFVLTFRFREPARATGIVRERAVERARESLARICLLASLVTDVVNCGKGMWLLALVLEWCWEGSRVAARPLTCSLVRSVVL